MAMQMIRLLLIGVMVCWGLGQAARAADTIHQFEFQAIEGGELPLSQYAGQPILLVNTASLCGFTYQYEQLQAVWERYQAQGLIVLGVPSNDFGRQEPGNAAQIQEFCDVNFAITFPMSDKVAVRGAASHPVFDFLRAQLGSDVGPSWNFNKYLIDAQGVPQAHWPSGVRPDDQAIVEAIEAALAAS